MTAGTDLSAFDIRRDFRLPRERVWRAWSEAGQLQQWWGPKGCTVEVARFEFRPGGFCHYAMRLPNVPVMWGRFNYREIDAPGRLVWLNSFANGHGGIERAPFSEDCPLEIENIVTFTENAGITTVALRARPFGALEAERRFFEQLGPALEQGYGGTFEQLADHLARS